MGGVLYVFSTEKGVVARTGRRIQAMYFVRQKLEELKNKVGGDTWPGGDLAETDPTWAGTEENWTSWELLTGDFGEGGKFEGQGRRYRVRNIDADTTFDSDNDGDATNDIDYKQVEVVVDWQEPAE